MDGGTMILRPSSRGSCSEALYPKLMATIMWPGDAGHDHAAGRRRAGHTPASGLTVLDAELGALEASILELCAHLLGAGCRVAAAGAGAASAGGSSAAGAVGAGAGGSSEVELQGMLERLRRRGPRAVAFGE